MAEKSMNLRGLKCPLPALRARKALAGMQSGEVLSIECTDPLTAIDVPAFTDQTGHTLSVNRREGEVYIFKIVKRR